VNPLKDASAILSVPLHFSWGGGEFVKQPLNLMLELQEHWCIFSVWHITVIACAII